MISVIKNGNEIEVACFMSTFPDVTGTEEGKEKGNMPKEEGPYRNLGHTIKNRMTVIRTSDGALSNRILFVW